MERPPYAEAYKGAVIRTFHYGRIILGGDGRLPKVFMIRKDGTWNVWHIFGFH